MHIDPRTATPCRTVAFSARRRAPRRGELPRLRDPPRRAHRRRPRGASSRRPRSSRRCASSGARGACSSSARASKGGATRRREGHRPEHRRAPPRAARAHGRRDRRRRALAGERRRVASVGLDCRVVVHDVADPSRTWAGALRGLREHVRRAPAARRAARGRRRLALDLRARRGRARRGREARDPRRLQRPALERGRPLRARRRRSRAASCGSTRTAHGGSPARRSVGGAAKRMVVDPGARRSRALVASYDGRVWSVARSPEGSAPFVAVDRRRGMWGINVAATATRLAVPSFFDRAYLIGRGPSGEAGGDDRPRARPDLRLQRRGGAPALGRNRDHPRRRPRACARRGRRRAPPRPRARHRARSSWGAAFHPTKPLLATVDFYGELLVYDATTGASLWRGDLGFGPGISVDFSPCGRFLAAGGYTWAARVLALGDDGLPARGSELDAPNRGVVKSLAFAGADAPARRLGRRRARRARARGRALRHARTIRGDAPDGAVERRVASPDGRTAYVVSRDQTLRAFDLESGAAIAARARPRPRGEVRRRLGVRPRTWRPARTIAPCSSGRAATSRCASRRCASLLGRLRRALAGGPPLHVLVRRRRLGDRRRDRPHPLVSHRGGRERGSDERSARRGLRLRRALRRGARVLRACLRRRWASGSRATRATSSSSSRRARSCS